MTDKTKRNILFVALVLFGSGLMLTCVALGFVSSDMTRIAQEKERYRDQFVECRPARSVAETRVEELKAAHLRALNDVIECRRSTVVIEANLDGCSRDLRQAEDKLDELKGQGCPPVDAEIPDAMCIDFNSSAPATYFNIRVSFHVPGRGWLATPDWTPNGLRFDYNMGMHLGPGDRNFLRHRGGNPLLDGMEWRSDRQGNMSYHVFPQGSDADIVVCSELLWQFIQEPGSLAPEAGGPE